jgi:ribosome-binding factor A
MAHSKRGYKRSDRVGQQLHEVIATLLLTDVDDPRVQQVQVTAVDVSPDLTIAKVFYVMLDEREPDPRVQTGLERIEGYLKHEISQRLSLRYTPHLQFIYDESIERGRRMDALLSNLDKGDEEE